MERQRDPVDSSHRRPAAVLVIDLVRHSTRAKEDIRRIQAAVEEVFSEALRSLGIDGVLLNYTGDGYVCAFPGNAAARAIDFINAAFPILQARLGRLQQSIRGGLDFGLIHPQHNRLTGGYEHFDEPGIRAARLEQAAPGDQILCSETVYNIFAPYYPAAFSDQSIEVQTKDRKITCYRLEPADHPEIKAALMAFIYDQAPASDEDHRQREHILIVEDDQYILEYYAEICRTFLPWATAHAVRDGQEALGIFRPNVFGVAVLDIHLPFMNGIALMGRLRDLDPDLTVLMATADHDRQLIMQAFNEGAFKYLLKPFEAEDLVLALRQAFFTQLPAVPNLLRSMYPQPGAILERLQAISRRVRDILAESAPAGDVAQSLVRHKLKALVNKFCDSARPGADLVKTAELLQGQVASLARLVSYARHAKETGLTDFLCRYVSDLGKQHEGLEITLEIDGEAEPDDGSTAAGAVLTLVICELIDNAIAAVGQAGKVAVSLAALASTHEILVTVRDSGPGVSQEHLGRLFESGYSTKGPGRGLGLYLVREAVRRLGGEITYQSHKGTTFTARTPLRLRS